jgi:uncharacterized protein (TIGR02598 family)
LKILTKSPAFSLIEVVLALGVISFAIVGIMGLFPVALRAGLESQRETRATHIARTIFSEIQASSPTNAIIAVGPSSYTNFALSNATPLTIFYDGEGSPTISADSKLYTADIRITPNSPTQGIAHLQIDISAPPQAATTNQSKFSFVTLMRQQ